MRLMWIKIKLFLYFFQAVVQTAESLGLLPILIRYVDRIFQGKTEMVLNTTVKEFLFDGIEICKNGFPVVPCSVIKAIKPKTIHSGPNKSLLVALFKHVSLFLNNI